MNSSYSELTLKRFCKAIQVAHLEMLFSRLETFETLQPCHQQVIGHRREEQGDEGQQSRAVLPQGNARDSIDPGSCQERKHMA